MKKAKAVWKIKHFLSLDGFSDSITASWWVVVLFPVLFPRVCFYDYSWFAAVVVVVVVAVLSNMT